MRCLLEGSFATLERGGDRPAGSMGMRMGRTLGFFESFTFFQIGRRLWAFAGPVALICVCVLKRSEYPDQGVPNRGTRYFGTRKTDKGPVWFEVAQVAQKF